MFNFLAKKMMKKQMKGVPEDQQDMLLAAVEKDPDFFQKLAVEIQEKMKEGKGQQEAAMEVMMAHQERLSQLIQK